jgi:hypothetical protein
MTGSSVTTLRAAGRRNAMSSRGHTLSAPKHHPLLHRDVMRNARKEVGCSADTEHTDRRRGQRHHPERVFSAIANAS